MTLFGSAAAQLAAASPAALIILKATVISALGLAGAWLARGTRAAVRHAVLAAAFAVLLALPFAAFVIPPLRIAVATTPVTPIATAAASMPIAGLAPSSAEAPRAPFSPPAMPEKPLPLSTLLFAAWAAGTVAFVAPVLAGAWKLRALCRSALPWVQQRSAADELARAAGIGRPVELLLHESLPGPMTCGVLRPKVLLPCDADTWQAEELNRAIVHELEHVRRADWLVQCVARAVCALYWFHPLVWMAWRRLSLEAERSCDDAVLANSESTTYADQLVALAQRMMAAKSPVTAMASRTDLAVRVRSVLDTRVRRGRAGARLWVAASLMAAAVLATVSPLKLVSAPRTAGVEQTEATAPVSAADSAAVSASELPPAQPVPVSAPTRGAGQQPRYYITGEVGRPGAFDLRERTEPTQALAVAPAEAPASQAQTLPPAQAPIAAAGQITLETAVVLVTVTATDVNGRSMAGISASEFALTDNGVLQQIAYFAYREADAQNPARYELGYYTFGGAPDVFHRLGVTLRNPAAKLSFREGYYPWRPSPPAAVPPPAPGITPPSVIRRVSPEYSEEALKAKYQGTVVLRLDVDANGEVTGTQVRRSLGLGLDEKAKEAVQRWRFRPCMNNGTPVPSTVDVMLNFRLQ